MMGAVDVLVGSAEITELLGVSRPRTFQITSGSGFPAPVQELKMGKIWRLSDVQAWAERTGRQLHEPSPRPTR
jgi:prophage regulatory protein